MRLQRGYYAALKASEKIRCSYKQAVYSSVFYEFPVNSIIFKGHFSFVAYNWGELEQAVSRDGRDLPPGRSHYVW